MDRQLSLEQKQFLYSNGYIVIKNAVSDDLVSSALSRIKSAKKGENLSVEKSMTDLVNASSITPVLNEVMGQFDPPQAAQIGVLKKRQPGDHYNNLGYKDKDMPYYGTELHMDGNITIATPQTIQQGTYDQLVGFLNSRASIECSSFPRNLKLSDVKKFKIGYVEKSSSIFDMLKKEFSENILKETGLFYFDEKKKIFVERFKNRIIFPINNISGKPIALGGRTIQNNAYLAKYINSPETPFFKKGSNLYNLDFARKLSNKVENIFLVEGYMDVVGLSKIGVENAVANLGTALTEKQILTLNQFFDHIIICFDGDESGYKAAIRAAENSIKNLQPDKKISFLFLPDNEDPDSFTNKNGKNYFIDFTKQNKISIHQFIFDHYNKQTDNNPSSLAIFEKKLRSIANTIRDKFIQKYVLEYFLERVSSFTPHLNNNKKKFFTKKLKSLKSTQKYFNESKSISQIEIKEFSLLYLILNNLKIFQENVHLIEKIKLFTTENKLVFDAVLSRLKNDVKFTIDDLSIDSQLIEKIFKFAVAGPGIFGRILRIPSLLPFEVMADIVTAAFL